MLVNADGQQRNICVWAQRRLKLGKQRDVNDLVLRLLPASSCENVDATARISREHAELAFATRGVAWRNLRCANGTQIGGDTHPAEMSVLLRSGEIVVPAGVLKLRCDLFYDDPIRDDPSYLRFVQLRRDASDGRDPEDPSPIGPVASVRLRRVDNLPQEEYVLLQRAAYVGSGPACAIQIPHPTVQRVHAQMLLLGGRLWLEPTQELADTLVDNQRVPRDHLVPLRPALSIRLGQVDITVLRVQQYYLDIYPEFG